MYDFFDIFEFVYLICLGVFFLFLLAGMIRYFIGIMKKTTITKTNITTKFAIIIPARDESKVIENNLKSIMQNNYPLDLFTIYLIVESEDDPTVEIAKKYPNTKIFYRVNLNNVGKGYALDECIQYIYEFDDNYDAFLIIDADNLISPNFLSRMNDAYNHGYDIACGKRENKDWNASVVCGAAGLTFTIINSIQNKPKTNYGMKVTITGTGYYLTSDVLREASGWPFHTLTEDYELTNYALVHDLKTAYIEDAIFYDEQPLKLRQSIVERSRWIRGYFSVRKKYKKEKKKALKKNKNNLNFLYQFIGGIPMIAIALITIAYLICCIVVMSYSYLVHDGYHMQYLIRVLCLLGAMYLAFILFTQYLFFIDRKYIKITPWNRFLVTLFHPVFMFTYINAAVRAPFVKNKWEKIEHSINVDAEDVK